MLIEVEGERFAVGTRVGAGGAPSYDFTWLNGPHDATYGFTLGLASPSPAGVSRARLEEEARLFVHAFFSPDGIGPSDFPDFVASRRTQADSAEQQNES